MRINPIMLSDSYKYSHFKQYPSNMISMFDYAEARSGKIYPDTVFVGLQFYIREYLMKAITMQDIIQAQKYAEAHGIPFDVEGWQYIVKEHNGYFPVEIKAVKEGSVVPTGNVLFTIESTDSKVPWVAGFLETLLMKVWYPSNIATRSYYVRKMIEEYWEKTVCDRDSEAFFGVNFSYHNFGDRGSSSVESAAIGGVAHLTQFMGTDNFFSLVFAEEAYDEPNAGFSIPATEHSTTTSWTKEGEYDMIMNHIEVNKGNPIIAAVCDSYNYLKTVDVVTSGEFKEKIESDSYPKFVIRPDSGDPVPMIEATLDIMEKNEVQYTVNEKGYKEFKKYGIIWGDGIDMNVMKNILDCITRRGYAASNVSFGSGGWLMQDHDRDTSGWAVKCSSITLDEGNQVEDEFGYSSWEPRPVQRNVYKDPITAPSKKSKKGRITLWYNKVTEAYFTDKIDLDNDGKIFEALNVVYRNGEMFNKISLEEVRANSRK